MIIVKRKKHLKMSFLCFPDFIDTTWDKKKNMLSRPEPLMAASWLNWLENAVLISMLIEMD